MSTSGGYHDACGGYHEYIRGCSVQRGDTMSTSEGYHEYIGGCSVHRGVFLLSARETINNHFIIASSQFLVIN